MNLHRVIYTQDGIVKQEFFGSDAAASKRSTELRKLGTALDGKPEREPIDVPTNKEALLIWLNENASLVKE